MLTHSIYFRMTFWYVLAVGFITGILSICLYVNFSRVLNKDFNHLLESRAGGIAQVIDEASTDQARDRRKGVGSAESDADFMGTLRNAVEWRRDEGFFIQVFRDGLEVVHSSNGPASAGGAAWPSRTFSLSINKDNAVYVVQITASLRPVVVKLGRIRTVLLFFLPLAMILVTVMGFFLTRTTLSPVDNMTKAMRQITSRNLKRRITVPDLDDETKRLAETFNDMLTRLDKAFSLQQQLIQDVSHELRTPLTALKGKQEVALNRRRSPEEYEAILGVNLEEIDKMNALVENLLDLAQLDRAEYELKMRSLLLTALVRKTLENARPLAKAKGITLRLLSSDEVAIDGDERQLGRAIANVVDNAIKYAFENGQVAARVSQKEAAVELTINDTGIGIAREDLPRVFDRFFRAEKSRTSPGFGIGLSIVKAIVLAHHGTIRVESEPDQGSTFIITLPKQA